MQHPRTPYCNLTHFILVLLVTQYEINIFIPRQFIQLYYNFSIIEYGKAACTGCLMMNTYCLFVCFLGVTPLLLYFPQPRSGI